MTEAELEPRRIWWARPRKLCVLERPGGGGRNHRADRRAGEIAWLRARGVRMVVSVMRSRHNLSAYEAAGLDWHHVPLRRPEDAPQVLEELLPLLGDELSAAGAIALHGDVHTDFVAAVGAAHADESLGMHPALSLTRAAAAGLTVTAATCALLGVDEWEVDGVSEAA